MQGAGELQNWEGGTAQGVLGTWLGLGQELLPRLAWGCAGCAPAALALWFGTGGCQGAVLPAR